MTLYPTPRLLILLAALLPAAVLVGVVVPHLWGLIPAAGLGLLVLGLIDSILSPTGAGAQLEMILPKSIGVGRSRAVAYTVRFSGFLKPSRIEARFECDPILAASSTSRYPQRLKAGEFAGTLNLVAHRRGPGEVRGLWVRWPGLMGLIQLQTRLRLDEGTVPVTPDLKGVEEDASSLFSRDTVHGLKVHDQLHLGSEFHALRDYDSSQDHRRIDWRSSARHVKLLSREFQAERNHHIILAFDTGRLMGEPLSGLSRLDRALHAGLLLGYCALKVGDTLRCFDFAASPGALSATISGVQGFEALKRQVSAISDSSEETNHTFALADLRARVGRRSLMIVFTDFFDEISADLMIEALGRLSKTHQVLFVAFRDLTADHLIQASPASSEDVTRAVFGGRINQTRERVLTQLRRDGVEVLETEAEGLATAVVSRYLALKRAGRL